MTLREVNKNESVSLYAQVAAEIRRAISEGEAAPGERLPSAIDLAEVIGVNKNTVIRALHILRDEGLLDFTRGRGIRVVATPGKSVLQTRINELLDYARKEGYRREDILAIIEAQA
jgi:GntR family transcriptional regulator